jgi:hypothetical protein
LLLMSFASVAMADGPGPIPPVAKPTKPPIAGMVRLADGPGPIPPVVKPTKPPMRYVVA